jgi:EpsI family protein
MIGPKDINLQRWVIPLASTAFLLAVLFLLFPFNSGDSSSKDPLGFALWSMWTTSSNDSQDFSYCLLVPIMVGYLIFEKKSKLAAVQVGGSTAAIGWIIFGLLLFWIGARAGKQYVGCAGIQIILAGVILWYWGTKVFRPLLFTWVMICFAWPLPFLDTTVAFPMRMMVSSLAHKILNIIGIYCIQDGTALISAANAQAGIPLGARFQIDIADPCSGLHSLLPLLMFSACFSYTFLPRRWQQWTVFLSAIPLVIVGNVVRILLLVIGCITWGSAFAIGTDSEPSAYHEGCGYAVFVVVLGLECLFAFLLIAMERRRTKGSIKAPVKEQPATAVDPASLGTVKTWRNGVILGFAVLMGIIAWITPPLYLPSQAGVVMNLPSEVTVPEMTGAQFFGFDTPVSDVEHRMLPKDTEFARKNYNDLQGHNIFFSIVLSGLQQYTIHPPQICLVAQGWKIAKEEDVPIHLNSGHDLVVRNLTIERDLVNPNKEHRTLQAYYMYWYVADGLTTPSHATRNWVSSRDRVLFNRDHRWAYVIAMSPIAQSVKPDGLDADKTREMLSDFIRQIVPTIQKSEVVGQVGSIGGE